MCTDFQDINLIANPDLDKLKKDEQQMNLRWGPNFTSQGSPCSPCLRGEVVFGTFITTEARRTRRMH